MQTLTLHDDRGEGSSRPKAPIPITPGSPMSPHFESHSPQKMESDDEDLVPLQPSKKALGKLRRFSAREGENN